MTPSTYIWAGGSESMLRFGPAVGPAVVVAMALFEEANRTRGFVNAILTALADRGIAGAIADLPGTGDSLVDTEDAALSNWQNAFSAAVSSLRNDHSIIHSVAIRGGALLDGDAPLAGRYHFAPATGARLVRDLLRTRLAAAREDGRPFDPAAIAPPGPPIELAGNYLNRQLLADLTVAVPTNAGALRIARLSTDTQSADIKFAAAPLWRRAEPDNDPALAKLVAGDIATWIATCAA